MLSRVQVFCCPTCGSHIGEAAPVGALLDAVPTGAQHIILEELTRKIGAPVRRNDLINSVYPRFRPARPEQNIAVYINRMRRRIEKHGWCIVTTNQASGIETAYRLIPREAGA